MERNVLVPRLSGGGTAAPTDRGWRLTIPPGDNKTYRLAQLDDHFGRARSSLLWRPPVTLQLRARASGLDLPGTWGFGFWNNPFGFACGPTRELRQLPALPQSAWFFYASPKSYLSLGDEGPGNGFFAQLYRSSQVGMWLLQAALTLPFSVAAMRRMLRRRISEDAVSVTTDVREWQVYQIEWSETSSTFAVDGNVIVRTRSTPQQPLGLIIWIDNQYAAFDPRGRLAWGVEASPTESWLEIEDLEVRTGAPRPGQTATRPVANIFQ